MIPTNCEAICATPKSIALLGLFGGGNLGNEASLVAMLTPLREAFPDAIISCICGNPAAVTERYSISAVGILPETIRWPSLRKSSLVKFPHWFFLRVAAEIQIWLKIFRYLRTVEFVIIPGTGILDDYRLSPFDVPYNILRWCLSARLLGIKILFVSIGAGPIHHPLTRLFMKTTARTATYRSYRDNVSRDYMNRIGLNVAKDPVYPDLVFSLPHPSSIASDFDKIERKQATIGIGVMRYYGRKLNYTFSEAAYNGYIKKISEFVCWLINHKYNVRFMIGETPDQSAVDDVLNAIQAKDNKFTDSVIFSEPIRTIYDLFEQISKTDVVVASRFHNVVCALMLNKPVLSLGYAERFDELMSEMGLGTCCQNIENFDVKMLIKQFKEVEKKGKEVSFGIQEKNRKYLMNLDKQFGEIFTILKFLKSPR